MVGDPLYLKFWVKLTRWSKNADFQSIFARSALAVTSSEKSSINTNRKSTKRFPIKTKTAVCAGVCVSGK